MDSPIDMFPVVHSTLSPEALLSRVTRDYNIGNTKSCLLLKRGWNDTYLIKTPVDRYILRVYRSHWRDLSTVSYELDLLDNLVRNDVAVSSAIPSSAGERIVHLRAPEGNRCAVLFTYSPGEIPDLNVPERMREFGSLAARIHAVSDRFETPYRRAPMDPAYLLDMPVQAMEPYLRHRDREWRYLESLVAKLRRFLEEASKSELDYGPCHGDLHSGNAHVVVGRVELFDFDFCGPGWRAYDLAAFASIARMKRAEASWYAFLGGYREHRKIATADLRAMHYFIPIRYIWLLGIHSANSREGGAAWLSDEYLDSWLRILKGCEAALESVASTANPDDIFVAARNRSPRFLTKSRKRLKALLRAVV